MIDEADIDQMIGYDALVPVTFHEVRTPSASSGITFDLLDLLDADKDDPHFEGGLAIRGLRRCGRGRVRRREGAVHPSSDDPARVRTVLPGVKETP